MQHLDEGTIHAWLDEQLPRDEALEVEAHVAECRQCADAVAEARGLIAASSRILMALDSVPREVMPKSTAPRNEADAPSAVPPAAPLVVTQSRAQQRAHRRWFNGGTLAAAAAIVVAIGTLTVMRENRTLPQADGLATPTVVGGPLVDSSRAVAATAQEKAALPTPAAPPSASATVAERRAIARAPEATPTEGGVDAVKKSSNDLGRSASSDNARERAEPKPLERRQQLADAASNLAPSLSKTQAQSQVAASSKPADELTKDKKQEALQVQQGAQQLRQVQQPPARVDGFAARDNRAKGDTVRLDRPQAREADIAAKVAQAGGVRGRVIDGNNTGLSGAMVRIDGTNTGVLTTDAGEFTLGGLTPGSHRMTVRRVGYAEATRDLVVVAGQTTTTDVVLSPAPVALGAVVATAGAANASRAGAQGQGVPTRSAAPAPAPVTPQASPAAPTQPSAAGCYELGITPTSTPSRTGFRQMPRSVALDSDVTPSPSTAEGVWYRARDLSKTGALPNGAWRPTGAESIELTWTYGSRTAQIYLNGRPGGMLSGTIQEIDRATATGEAGTVVTIRRACQN